MFDVLADTRSVYVHWPFCPYRCHYCPFVALAGQDQYMDVYHQALCREIKHFARVSGKKYRLDTLFLGGGTPSTYPEHLLLDMFGILKETFVWHDETEVTIEVNPGTVTDEKLAAWRDAGINRMSVGVQSLKDGVLHSLNRMQTQKDVEMLLNKGPAFIPNISADMILGLPGVSVDEWKEFVSRVVEWPIKHMSVYFLTVHEDTPLYFKVKQGVHVLPADDVMVQTYEWTRHFLHKKGFMQYELSNFARPGYESRHNTVYWDRKPYKAFGLGACSFDGSMRFQNEKNLMKYITKANEDKEVIIFSESLTTRQVYLERLMLNMRRRRGITWHELVTDLSAEDQSKVRARLELFVAQEFIELVDDRYVLTIKGLAVENEVITQLWI